jgi:response regulator RpfG family c-di-GMP phosphodiesterase
MDAVKVRDGMHKIMIVDDDDAMLGLFRIRLGDSYEIVETEDPEQALGLALEHKPEAILLDLTMPKLSGFELCENFRSLSYTSLIPIFVVSGSSKATYREHCENLGIKGYFEKPIDFTGLKKALETELKKSKPERRTEARLRMRIPLKLRGTDGNAQPFEESTVTENVSANGFLCATAAPLLQGTCVQVFLAGDQDVYAGRAQVVRSESPGIPKNRYGFKFIERTSAWILQPS